MTSERTHHRLLYAEAVESNRGGQACVWCGHARHTQRSYAQPDVAPAAAPTTNWRDTQHNTFCNLFPRYTKKARNAPKRLVACHSRKLRERHEQQRNKEKKRLTKQQIPSSCATAIPTQSIPPADSPGPNPAALPPPSPAPAPPASRGGGSPTGTAAVARPSHGAHPPLRVAGGGGTDASRGGGRTTAVNHIRLAPPSGRRSTRGVARAHRVAAAEPPPSTTSAGRPPPGGGPLAAWPPAARHARRSCGPPTAH